MSRYESSSPTKRRRLPSVRFPEHLNEQELQDMRDQSIAKLHHAWSRIESEYGQEHQQGEEEDSDDEIDLDRLDDEAARHWYFREPASRPETAVESEEDANSDEPREGREGDSGDDSIDGSSSSSGEEHHYAYFQAARRRVGSIPPTPKRHHQRVTSLTLSDCETEQEKASSRAAPTNSPTLSPARSTTASDSEAAAALDHNYFSLRSNRSTPSTPPDSEASEPPPRSPSNTTRPVDTQRTFARLHHHIPSFSPAPSSSQRSSASPEPSTSRVQSSESRRVGGGSSSSNAELDSKLRSDARGQPSSPEQPSSGWKEKAFTTPTRALHSFMNSMRSPALAAQQPQSTPPSTCQKLPVAALSLNSPSKTPSTRRPPQAVLQPTHQSSSPSRHRTSQPGTPRRRSSPKKSSIQSSYVSLETLSRPMSPSTRQRPSASGPTKTASVVDLCSSASESESSSETKPTALRQSGQHRNLARASTSCSDSDSESGHEHEVARWG